jgi:hypothetical protein
LQKGKTENEGAQLVREMFSTGQHIYSSSVFIIENEKKNRSFPRGDFAILWGIGSNESNHLMTQNEYKMIWKIMNYLSDLGFRVIMSVRAEAKQVKEVVETEGVSVVLYSGHGNTTGFYDFFENLIPHDLFKYKAKSLYQFILSACHGTESRANYQPPSDMIMYTWTGTTTSLDLESFLMGDWDATLGYNLSSR